ncbi:MAG: hypothetical protein WCB18_04485 [Thermoplasmata archaeon]
MSPKRSSTSSGNSLPRPRYLGIEVAGDPSFSPRALERWLSVRLATQGPPPKLRVVRVEGRRALVDVPHTWANRARAAWAGRWTAVDGTVLEVRTYRTWGTLVGGKRWLRRREPPSQVGFVSKPLR